MINNPVVSSAGGASFHFVSDLTNGSSSLNGVHISEGAWYKLRLVGYVY